MTSSFEYLLSGSAKVGIDLWDPQTGAPLAQHAQPSLSFAPNSCSIQHSNRSHTVYGCDIKKPYLHTLSLTSDSLTHGNQSMTSSLTNVPAVIAFNHSFRLLALVSQSSTSISIYQSINHSVNQTTGRLWTRWNAHFAPVKAVCFSDDDRFLITAGDDGQVLVWAVADILASLSNLPVNQSINQSINQSLIKPFCSFTSHSLPITALHVTSDHIYSCSLDHTVCVHSIASQSTVRQFVFPCIVRSVVVTSTCDALIVGGEDGRIFYQPLTQTEAQRIQLLNNQSTTSQSNNPSTTPPTKSPFAILNGHTHPVLSLALSYDSATLASASSDGSIRIWELHTRQCLRTCRKNGRTTFDYVTFVRNEANGNTPIWSNLTTQPVDNDHEKKQYTVLHAPSSIRRPFDYTEHLDDDLMGLSIILDAEHETRLSDMAKKILDLENQLANSKSQARHLYAICAADLVKSIP